jgi:hypothetical protein
VESDRTNISRKRLLAGKTDVELRGIEPLTPTLPESSITPEQAVQDNFYPVVGVAEDATVVTVVVKTVVRSDGPCPGRL